MRRRLPPPWALTVLVALLYVATAPPTTDLAAQEHRIAVARDGAWLYDLSWFGGHHLPGYSVLMPLLGIVLGATVLGAVAAVGAAWAFARLARGAWPGRGGEVAAWWFAVGVGGLLFTGRITFVLGAAVALATLLAARDLRGRAGTAAAVVGAVLTALASPVAALFLALVAGSWWLGGVAERRGLGSGDAAGPGASTGDAAGPATTTDDPTRPSVRADGPTAPRSRPFVVAVVALVAAGALAFGFPTGGSEPFVASALWPAVAVLGIVLLVLPSDERTLRIGVAAYLAAVVLSGLLPTPMGGNATRLAALAGGPVVAAALWGRRPVALALLALPLLYWQWYPPVRDATQGWGDDSATASYWTPVRSALDARLADDPARVEVPPTARRGEVRWLTPEIPLARGWIRQLDRDRNARFYADLRPDGAGPLTGEELRRWLDDGAVGWVALPDATPDGASRDEVALLRAGRVPGLRKAWSNAHWTLWRVEGARPLASWATGTSAAGGSAAGGSAAGGSAAGGATVGGSTAEGSAATAGAAASAGSAPSSAAPRVARSTPAELTVVVPRAGTVDLRVRWSPFLRATAHTTGADPCLTRGSGGWTRIRTRAPATVVVGTGIAVPWRQPSRSDCTP